jgi:hypothetical protein
MKNHGNRLRTHGPPNNQRNKHKNEQTANKIWRNVIELDHAVEFSCVAFQVSRICYHSAPTHFLSASFLHKESLIMVKIYGIKNCDTMKKAFAWCAANSISYEFHDYKKLGVPREKLVALVPHVLGWQTLSQHQGHHLAQAQPQNNKPLPRRGKLSP